MRSDGQDETLDTACRDHNLVVFLEGAGVAGPETVLDDPQWVKVARRPRPRIPRRLADVVASQYEAHRQFPYGN
ncbi:hypothetical protein ACIQTN_33150 [Streptomyces werraensis]|uniref:hypothetical protein n=1 Tax=Streptomyces werraensis TaxID=68284 RepID=UPI00382967A1